MPNKSTHALDLNRDAGGFFKALLIAAAAAFVALAFVYPGMLACVAVPTSSDLTFNDLWDQNVPLRVWGARSLLHGHLPLWFPGCYGGLPLASLPEAVPYYFPSTLFYMFLPAIPATAFTIVIHLFLAGVGAALLARHFGASLAGQIMAAVLMSVGLHLPEHMRQLNILQAEAWIPWVWLYLDRLLVRPNRRDAAALGFTMGMLGLAGHPQILHHTIVILGIWGVFRIFAKGQWRTRAYWTGRIGWVICAAAIAIMIALPDLGPILDLSRYVDRSQSPRFVPSPKTLGMLVNPMLLGDPKAFSRPFFEATAWEQICYIGLAPLAIAAGYGILYVTRRRLCRGLLLLAAISLFLAYGPGWEPARRLIDLIPMEKSSRFPHRYLFFFNHVLIILAALGTTRLLKYLSRKFGRLARPRLGAFFIFLMLAVLFDLGHVTRILNPVGDASAIFTEPATLAAFEKTGAAPGGFGERGFNHTQMSILSRALKFRNGWNHIPELEKEVHRFFLGEHPSMWDWQVVGGYVGLVPFWVSSIIGDQHNFGIIPLFDGDSKTGQDPAERMKYFLAWNGLLGGRWLASPSEIASPDLKPVNRIQGKYFDTYLYENRLWAGAAWISRNVKTYADNQAMFQDMIDHLPDPRVTRVLQDSAPKQLKLQTQALGMDRVYTPQSSDPEHVAVECDLAAPAFLVINQSWHPRWSVRIDGGEDLQPARVNVCQTGVWVDAGKHRVEFEYTGTLEKTCIGIGFLGCIAAIFCAFNMKKRRLKPENPKAVA